MFGQETASVGSLRSKLDIKHYALELATKISANDKVLEKAKEIEEYLLKDTEIPVEDKVKNPVDTLFKAMMSQPPTQEKDKSM